MSVLERTYFSTRINPCMVFTKEVHSIRHPTDPLYNQVSALRESYLQSLARTVYPYVPRIYTVNGSTIEMEEVIGTRLDIYLLTGGYRYLRQILVMIDTLLKQIHSIGLIHNDLHIGNLIVADSGELYLIDFGNSFLIRMMPDISFAEQFQVTVVNETEAFARDDFIYMDISRTLALFMDDHLYQLYGSPTELGLNEYPPAPAQHIPAYKNRIAPIFNSKEMTMDDYKHTLDLFVEIFES